MSTLSAIRSSSSRFQSSFVPACYSACDPVRDSLFTLFLASSLSASWACGEPKSKRCQQICQTETDCAERRSQDGESVPYDLEECVDACANLERDKNNRAKVDEHERCVKEKGDDCAAIMQCRF